MHPFVVFLLIAAGLSLLAYLWRQDQKRQEALRAWTRSRRWKIDRDKRKGWDRDLPGIALFGKGHSRWGRNVITGEHEGRPVTLLDYKHTTGHGKHRTDHRHGVVILHCDFATIPLFIRREHAFDKVGEFLGADDIDFESAEFSRKFYVKSSDRKWAYDVIHTRTMDYLLGDAKARKVQIEFGFAEIAVYRSGFCDPVKYEEALDVAWNLYRLIPDYVVEQMKGGAS